MVPRPLQKLGGDFSPCVHKFLTFDYSFYAFPNWYKVGESWAWVPIILSKHGKLSVSTKVFIISHSSIEGWTWAALSLYLWAYSLKISLPFFSILWRSNWLGLLPLCPQAVSTSFLLLITASMHSPIDIKLVKSWAWVPIILWKHGKLSVSTKVFIISHSSIGGWTWAALSLYLWAYSLKVSLPFFSILWRSNRLGANSLLWWY